MEETYKVGWIKDRGHRTFSVFLISSSSYADIRNKLDAVGMLWKHVSHDHDGQEILIFGATAMRAEKADLETW